MSEFQQAIEDHYDLIIAIPCYNEQDHVRRVVETFIEQTKDKNALLVILDGESQDKTAQIAQELSSEYQNVVYLNNPKRLQSAAINLAVKEFGDKADYILRIDAHADYPDNFCHALLEEQKSQDAASVVVSMNTVAESGFQKAVAAAQNSKMGNGGSSHRLTTGEGKWVDHGHHALFTTKSFKEVGGYDESFSHNEDAEYDYRLQLAGYKIWLTGRTHLDYYPRRTVSSLFRQYYNFGKGRAQNILKHKIKPKPRQMIPAFILPITLLFVLGILHPVFTIPFIFWLLACLLYGVYLSVQVKNPVIALSGIAAIIMHFSWSCGFWRGMQKNIQR